MSCLSIGNTNKEKEKEKAMTGCLRWLGVMAPIDVDEEKKGAKTLLKKQVDEAAQLVRDLETSLILVESHIKATEKAYRSSNKSAAIRHRLRDAYNEQKTYNYQLEEASKQSTELKKQYNEMVFSFANPNNMERTKQINRHIQRMGLSTDRQLDTVLAYNDQMSELQRYTESSRPSAYSGTPVTAIDDDEFTQRLSSLDDDVLSIAVRNLPEPRSVGGIEIRIQNETTIEVPDYLIDVPNEATNEGERVPLI